MARLIWWPAHRCGACASRAVRRLRRRPRPGTDARACLVALGHDLPHPVDPPSDGRGKIRRQAAPGAP